MNIIKKWPLISGTILIVIIIITGIVIFSRKNIEEQTMIAHRSDFINEISVSGKVVAAQSAELGFDQSGRIANIYAKVGDTVKSGAIIANIENTTVLADIAQKQASLEKEQAKLSSLQKGTRPEEIAIYEQKYIDASSALVITMRNTYLQTESAILNKSDNLFTNGNTINPILNIRAQNDNEKRALENERLMLSDKFQKWNTALSKLTVSSTIEQIKAARLVQNDSILSIKTFIDHVANTTGKLDPGNSGISQSGIDTYRSTINSAGQQISTASSAEQDSYANWSSAYNSLLLEKSGSTLEDIAAQSAQVKSAEADLLSSQAQLHKTTITAPFEGIITKMDLKIGEISSPNTSKISIMSIGAFEIESYIPEINISRIKINNIANVTLDAYGANTKFPASIISIDPAETLRDGVSTYKTRLQFTENDPRIKSGMTANIIITTESKPNVITIPQSTITERDGKKFIQIKIGNNIKKEVEITTGLVTSLGQIEIVSGLNEGDMIILPSITTP